MLINLELFYMIHFPTTITRVILEVRGWGSNRRNRVCVPLPLQVAVDGSLCDRLEGHTTGTIVLSNSIGLRHGYSHL